MGALRLALLACLLVSPLVHAQPEPDPRLVGDVVNQAQSTTYPPAENQSGEDVTSEDVDLDVLVDVRDAEFDLTGILLGGGSATTSIEVDAHLAIRAVNASRVEEALEQRYEGYNVSASETFGIDTSKPVFTADEIRTSGSGLVLEAFQAYQEEKTREYLADTLPQVMVGTTRFDWGNTRPGQQAGNETRPEPREPPLVLDASVQMEFLDRYSLADILQAQAEGNGSDVQTPQERLRERLAENQTVPLRQQSAFQVLGIGQLVSLQLPPGWRLNLTVELPKGYTFASATDALVVSEDRRTASYYVDGTGRSDLHSTSGVIELSDRSLVTTTIVGLVVAAGLLLRLPTEFAGLRWASREA